MNDPPYLLDLALPPCDLWLFPITETVVMVPSFPDTDDTLGNTKTALKIVPENKFKQCSEQSICIQCPLHSKSVKIILKAANSGSGFAPSLDLIQE